MENLPATVPGGLGPSIIASTLHASSPTGAYGLGGKFTFPAGDVTGMHSYGAIWSPGMLQFYVSFVLTAHVASGALVEQSRYTRPDPAASPKRIALEFPEVAPAFTVMGRGPPNAGAATALAL